MVEVILSFIGDSSSGGEFVCFPVDAEYDSEYERVISDMLGSFFFQYAFIAAAAIVSGAVAGRTKLTLTSRLYLDHRFHLPRCRALGLGR